MEMENNFYYNLLGVYHNDISAVISKDQALMKEFSDLVTFNLLWHPLERDKALKQYESNPVIGSKTFVYAIRTFVKRTRNPKRAFCNLLKILNCFKQFDDIIKGVDVALVRSSITLPLYEEPTPSNAGVEGTTSPAAASQSLPLTDSIKKYANHLKCYYPQIHATSKWSPSKCDEKMLGYVALEIVTNESARSITYTDFFNSGLSCKPSSWILIEGIPGIGKSTLAKEICERWGAGHLECSKFALVLLLQLRLPEVWDNWSPEGIRELIGIHLEGQSWKDEVVQDIIDSSGNGLLVILEGFDELQVRPEEISKRLEVLKILKRCLSCATFIITTRPGLVYQLKETVLFTKHFRILGFNKQSQDRYINIFFDRKKDSKESFKEFVDKNPLIFECLCVPLNLLIMLDIFNNKECYHDRLPETTTELYETLVMRLIRIELKTSVTQEPKFSSLNELPRLTFEKFYILCGMAYDGVLEQKLVFPEPSSHGTLGLMQRESKFYPSKGFVAQYSFYHLTIQEFLAAYYISLKEEEDIQSHFDKYNNDQSMLVTMRFLAGLTKLCNIHIEIPNDLISSVNIFYQLDEVKDDSLASKILSKKEITVARTTQAFLNTKKQLASSLRTTQQVSSVLTKHEFYLMGKYIALSSSKWKLSFTLRGLTKDHVKMFLDGFKSTKLSGLSCSINHVKLSLNQIGNEGVARILNLPPQVFRETTYFFVRGTSLNKDDIFEQWVPSIAHLASLKILLFHDNNFREGEQQQLIDVLCKLTDLEKVSFSSLGPKECSTILNQSKNLRDLELYELSLPCIGTTLASLHECKTLECIQILQSQITKEIIENNFHKSLPHSTLKTIMLINCGIDSNTAIAIVDAVALHSRTVHTLDLSDNVIDDKGVSCTAKKMGEIFKSQENPKRNITQLYLYRNSFTCVSIKEFIDELGQGYFPNDFLIHISLQWKDMIETSSPQAINHFRFEGLQ